MLRHQNLQTARVVQAAPFGSKRLTQIFRRRDFALKRVQLARFHLGAVADVVNRGDQRYDHEKAGNIKNTDHGRPPIAAVCVSFGAPAGSRLSSSGNAGAVVRTAPRNRAERAREFRASSSAPAFCVRFGNSSKLLAGPAAPADDATADRRAHCDWQEIFDHAVFQRVKCDDHEASARTQQALGRMQTAQQFSQLVIQINS